jgi:hypothetical protein
MRIFGAVESITVTSSADFEVLACAKQGRTDRKIQIKYAINFNFNLLRLKKIKY